MRKRRLPPVEEVARLYASGVSQTEIARRYGVTSNAVNKAIMNARGMGVKANHGGLTDAGKQPVAHIETHGDAGKGHIELNGVYRRRSLQLHECADLLREWGIA